MSDQVLYNNDFAPEQPIRSNEQLRKTEPQNIEAEKSVLAACMLSPEALEETASKLVPESFYRIAHQIIFASVLELYGRNIPVDHISLADNLQANGHLEKVGGRPYLVDLADSTFSLTSWRNHVEIVRRTYMLRELARASLQIRNLAYDAPDDLSVVVEDAEKILFNVTERRVSSEFKSMADLLSSAYAQIEATAASDRKIYGVETGFRDVDNLFHGLRGGDLIILAARPGVGKTSLALNMAVGAAEHGATVAFLSLEMSAEQLAQRILCSEARLDLTKVRAGQIREEDWGPLLEASSRLSKLKMFIDDTPSLSILELRAKARRELRGVEKGFIIVDYLQLMQPPKARRDGNRAVEVAEISRGLKILAKEMNMPVLALSQLSRQLEMRKSKRPQLSDLRESGSIEQDADIVMFIDRSADEIEAESDDRPEMGRAELIVAKHRNGPTRDIPLAFHSEYTRFMDFIDDSVLGDYAL